MFKRSNHTAPKPGTASQAAVSGPSIRSAGKPSATAATSPIAPGKQAYEARRAAKAGVSLDRWMSDKQKRAEAELEAARRARIKAEPVKAGFFKRLLDRAHKPLRD